MRFAFTDEQQELARVTREILTRECPPTAVRKAWTDDHLPAWSALTAAGIVNMTAPERFGGAGANELDLALVLEEAGRAALPGPLAAHTAVAIPLVAETCDDATCDRLLGGLLVVQLEGMPFVESAHRARTILVEKHGELHAIDPRDATIEMQRSVDRARKLATVTSRKTTLLSSDREALRRAHDRAAFAAAAELTGLARAMIERTVEYVTIRKQFGRAVGSFQAVKHMLAEAHVAVELARPCVHRAAYALAHREPDAPRDVSLAKALASDAAHLAAKTALQCHGAIGYSFEYDLHLWMKRAWALAAAHGSAADHRTRLAHLLLGEAHV
ncbi:MAG TPA: acyl-CoA dehydrogenase [Kofleriaceae bacterium]|nr:acyl-CoA dehydrogenase [Kofleriaceae bacterium]